MTVDEVTSVRAAGGTVVLDLTATDFYTLTGIAGSKVGTPLDLRVGSGPPSRAELGEEQQVLVPLGDPAAAAAAIEALEPYRPGPPRTGPGPLTVPLELWSVVSATAGPCGRTSSAGTRVVDRGGECMELRGPGVRIRSADLQVAGPDGGTVAWRVVVGIPAEDRPALRTWTRARVDERIAFVAGGTVVAGSPVLASELSAVVEVLVDDRAAAEALVTRLRP